MIESLPLNHRCVRLFNFAASHIKENIPIRRIISPLKPIILESIKYASVLWPINTVFEFNLRNFEQTDLELHLISGVIDFTIMRIFEEDSRGSSFELALQQHRSQPFLMLDYCIVGFLWHHIADAEIGVVFGLGVVFCAGVIRCLLVFFVYWVL